MTCLNDYVLIGYNFNLYIMTRVEQPKISVSQTRKQPAEVSSKAAGVMSWARNKINSTYLAAKNDAAVLVLPLAMAGGAVGAGFASSGCMLDKDGQGDLFPPGTGVDGGQDDSALIEAGEDSEVVDAVWPEGAAGGDAGAEDAADDVLNDVSEDVVDEADVTVLDSSEDGDVTDAAEEEDAPEDAPLDVAEEADAVAEAEAGPTCLTVNLPDMNTYTYALFNENGCDAANVVQSNYGQYEHGVSTFCVPQGKTYTLVLQVIDSADKNAAEMEFEYVGQVGPQSGIAAGGGNNQAMSASDGHLYCLAASGSWEGVSDSDPAGNKAKFLGNVWPGEVTPSTTFFNFKIISP